MSLLRQSFAVAGRFTSRVAVGTLAAVLLAGCSDELVVDEEVPVVTLSPASITAVPGDTVRVRVSATGNRPVSALVLGSSSTAARVDTGGLVTAVAPGTSVISATFDFNGQRVTGTIPVTVLGITLEPTAATIASGATVFLRATPVGNFAAYGGFRWSSSDSSIATVDQGGLVRGARGGVARIAVTATANPRVRTEATVTVVCTGPLLGTLTVSPSSATLSSGQTQQLQVSGTTGGNCGAPVTAVRDFAYHSSDTAVATVTPTGLITGRRGGTAVITVAIAALPGVTQAVTVTVRDRLLPIVAFQSVTTGDPPAPVDLTAVRGRIRVTLNYLLDPALDPRRLELWLVGRRAAATDSLARPAGAAFGTATFGIDTAERDPVTNARLYANGVTTLEARMTYAVPGSSVTQLVIVPLQLTLANP
jgi:uncharacterized protein YjdB